ncbi:MAG: efflux RND transporter periplasmic adaptor subunit [Acidobacteria bacterium]|nr:efflux RND transporter periplasmic adaptor subunit [Acidobacteriota bacterium]
MSNIPQSLDDELKSLRIDPAIKGRLKRTRRRRPWLLLLIGAMVIGGGMVALAFITGRALEVQTVQVALQAELPENSTAAVLTAGGYVVAHHKIQLGSKVMGKVSWIGVEKGDFVKRNQLLVRLEDQEYRARENEMQAALLAAQERLSELENGSRPQEIARSKADLELAEANLRNAKVTLDRTANLVKDGIMTQQNLDDARARYDVFNSQVESARKALDLWQIGPREEQIKAQRANVRTAQAALEFSRTQLVATEIRAPIDGTILERLVEKGEMVTTSFVGDRGAKSSVVSLADLNDLQVEIDVSQADFARLKMGQPAIIVPEAFADRRYEGQLEEIAPEANRQKATVQVKVKVLNPDSYLRPEMNAKVTFFKEAVKFDAVAPSKITIPRQAVIDGNGKRFVYLLVEGKAVSREVRLGAGNDMAVEITHGLAVGERLIVSQIDKVKEGTAVRAK